MPTIISYDNCLKKMFGLRRFGIKLGLDQIRRVLDALGNPHRNYSSIHLAGTNGKGSVAAGIAAILQSCGFRVGLYTSPHLLQFNERIRVNQRQVSNEAVVGAFHAVNEAHRGDRELTFFEFATAMAFYEFNRQHVDWAIVETGMGGRLDATNVLSPAVCVITNISIEHTDYLGTTIAEIAAEKAGIIKQATPVVSGVRNRQALAVLDETANLHRAPLFRFGRDFRVRQTAGDRFTYSGLHNIWRELRTPLPGSFQVTNAALALATVELVHTPGQALSRDIVQEGLDRCHWPGRLEVVQTAPTVILDGAHNLAAAKNLAVYLQSHYAGRRVVLVVGILDDKPYAAMLKKLLPTAAHAIFTKAKTTRALSPRQLADAARSSDCPYTLTKDVATAIRLALDGAQPDDVICIAGSLYVVGEAKAYFQGGRVDPQ